MPSGGTDDVIQVLASLENDGVQAATDFRLDLEIPGEFVASSGHRLAVESLTLGLYRLSITSQDEAALMTHLYPSTKTKVLIFLNCGVRDEIKRSHPEALEKEIIATVYSGNMKPRKTTKRISDLLP
jgi:hypothetical protein